jgi:hypothetical protein
MWLGYIDWRGVFDSSDFNGKQQKCCEILNKVIQQFVPLGYMQ